MAVEAAVTLYDIPSSKGPWSPNTRKARFTLNMKKIPYRTHYLSYPEIEPFMKSIGAKPTGKKPDGSADWYTCPVISVSGRIVEDSTAIMEYLDSAYPDTPRVFSPDSATKAEQLAFGKWFVGEVFVPVVRLLFPGVPAILDDAGAEYFRSTREKWFGSPLSEWTPAGSEERAKVWKTMKSGLSKLAAAYKKRENGASVWLIGDHPTYGDFVVLSFLVFVKRTIREDEWEELLGWHDAFWRKLWDASLPYQHVDSQLLCSVV